MTLLHTIYTDGFVESVEWTGELEYAAPPFRDLKLIIGCTLIEHVTVWWKDRRAHMFVDEVGHSKDLPHNWKATRIYFNASCHNARYEPLIYTDLQVNPVVRKEIEAAPTALKHLFLEGPPIVGVALLWEGDLE